jgi:hypothetical protein
MYGVKMEKYLVSIFKFKNAPFFFIILLSVQYLPQVILTKVVNSSPESDTLAMIVIVALLTLSITFLVFHLSYGNRIIKPVLSLQFTKLAIAIVIFYFFIVTIAAVTSQSIALFTAISGGTALDISTARELLFKSRAGPEKLIAYAYAILAKSFVPFIVVWMFHTKKRYSDLVLSGFLFTLVLSLEKAVTTFAMLPLIVYYVNTKSYRDSMKFLYVLIGIIGFSTILTGPETTFALKVPNEVMEEVYVLKAKFIHMTQTSRTKSIGIAEKLKLTPLQAVEHEASITPDLRKLSSGIDTVFNPVENIFWGNRNLFSESTAGLLLVNRILWIPYITALDWIRVQNLYYGGQYLYGRTSSLFDLFGGDEIIPYERQVFSFEWGQNLTATGGANTVFFVDAFVNYGLFGVVFSCIIVSVLCSSIYLSSSIPVRCMVFVQMYSLASTGLTAQLFSGGLALIFLVSFLELKSDSSNMKANI